MPLTLKMGYKPAFLHLASIQWTQQIHIVQQGFKNNDAKSMQQAINYR